MKTTMELTLLELGFKAFDPHELLVHFVARELGFYRGEGLEVRVRDVTFASGSELQIVPFMAACGSALVNALKGGKDRVLMVSTDFPMFWLYAQEELQQVADLKGKTLATYPAPAPPALFLRLALKKYGLDADRDVRLFPARDDGVRLGLLRLGEAQAALISSAVSPLRLSALNLHPLLFLGREIRVPTTGVAAGCDLLERDPDLVRRFLRATRQGLKAVRGEPARVVPVLARLLAEETPAAEQAYRRLRDLYTRSGRSTPEILENGVRLAASALDVAMPDDPGTVYDFSYQPPE